MLAKLSIRAKLIGIVAVVLGVGFLTTNLISLRVSSRALKQTILHNELPLTSSNIYSEIQVDLLRPIFVASLMSNDTFVKDWLLAGERDEPRMRRYLEEIRRKYGVSTSFLISGATHNYYHFSGVAQVVDEHDPEDVWFFRVAKMTQPYEINIDYNQAQDNAVTVFINYRVLGYDGEFLAVTGVGLKVDTVARVVDRYRNDYQRNVYFVDRQGRITVHAATEALNGVSIRTQPGLAAIADAMLAAGEGYFEYQRDGETILVTTRLIPELGWHVVVEQREADALRSLWRGFLTNLAIGAVIVALTILVIAYAINLYQRKLEHMATTDKLTGIGNRQVFDMALEHALKLHRRTRTPLSVVLIDIDHFKPINDTHGHLVGDQVIRQVAQIARRSVREADVLCRWGGEELIVLAEECGLADAVKLAEKVRLAIAAADVVAGICVTVSAGVSEAHPGDTADTVLGRADAALYAAKRAGRNRVAAEA